MGQHSMAMWFMWDSYSEPNQSEFLG